MEKASIPEYEVLEQKLIAKNAQFRDYFTNTGVIGDKTIKDPKKRASDQKKKSACIRIRRCFWRITR